MSAEPRERLFLIDGSHTLYRSYHAIRVLTTSKGFPTNAIYGFLQILNKIVREHSPEYLAVVFDAPGPNFRHEAYPEYKANRPPMPEDLSVQIPWIRKLLETYRVPCVELRGYEGDDVLATLAHLARQSGLDAVLVTGDKDLCQMVEPGIRMLDPKRDAIVGPEELGSEYGIPCDKLPDLFALTGDSIDNLPGVPGVGPKTAAALLQQFGSLDELLRRTGEIEKPRLRQLVEEHRERILKNRTLVRISTDVPLDPDLERFRRQAPDAAGLREIFRSLEFHRLLEELPAERTLRDDLYRLVLDEGALEELVRALEESREGFALDLETTSRNPALAEPVGISFAVDGDRAWYVPVGHVVLGAPAQLPLERVLDRLRPLLEDPGRPKFGQNIKYDLLVLKRKGVEVGGVAFDTMLASYLLDPSRKAHALADLALQFLQHRKITYQEVTEGGKAGRQIGFEEVELDAASRYSCEDAHATYRLTRILGDRLLEEGLSPLFHEIEMPLIEVLLDMEFRGIRIDVPFFSELAVEFRRQLADLENRIHEIAGEPFNVSSPQQLAKVLFKTLRLPVIKRTKTGPATDVKVLTRLAAEHPLPRLVLDYRSASKLLSTYVEALPRLADPLTGRVHTCFNQAVTATGRLSSSDPNLQNIPIRTAEGRRIRRGFIPEDGKLLMSADYSQIELRILAHVSEDERLLESFANDEDVHTRTASQIFDCDPALISDDMRRQAKVINFGVIYGMGAYGLAEALGIPRKTAQTFIEQYFAHYGGVKAWREACLEQCRASGYVTTLLNRRRLLPEIVSRDAPVRALAERTAINTPIQGTAADIIKLAMIRIHRRLRSDSLETRMLLQVHDELVFEVPEAELERARQLVREEMESVIPLKVRLKVDIQSGRNWSEAH
ncbi:MAG: DNA polymerase I [bacterium]